MRKLISITLVWLVACSLASSQIIIIAKKPAAGGGGIARVGASAWTFITTSTATVSVAYTATTGNALRVGWFADGTTDIIGCSDGASNTYTVKISSQAGATFRTVILHADNITGGSLTISCTGTASRNAGAMGMVVIEYSGVATSSADDGTPVAATGSSTAADSGALTPTQAGDLLIGLILSGTAANPCAMTAGTGWTMVASNTVTATNYCTGMEEWLAPSVAAHNATATVSSAVWAASITGSKKAP